MTAHLAAKDVPVTVVRKLIKALGNTVEDMTTDDDTRVHGVMVAFVPDTKIAKTLALPGGDSHEQLHLTLAYFGKEDDLTKAEKNCLKNLVHRLINLIDNFELTGRISGLGFFENPDSTQECLYASVDIPGLNSVYHWVLAESRRKGLPMRGDHGFTAHITLKYQPVGTSRPKRRTPLPEIQFGCSNLICKIGKETYKWDRPGDTECSDCGHEDCICIENQDYGKNFSSFIWSKEESSV